MKNNRKIILLLVFSLVPNLLYFAGWINQTGDLRFGGFLLNPTDGYSYLAKMAIGVAGDWKFRLPYTLYPGEGGYLFMYYIFLGHLARMLLLPTIVVFHAARIINGILLVLALEKFVYWVFGERGDHLRTTCLIIFGSGLGWLAIGFNYLSADYWIAESYPFISMISSPHFTLGMALLFASLPIIFQEESNTKYGFLGMMGIILSIAMPFGIITAGIFLCVSWLMYKLKNGKFPYKSSTIFLIPGLILLLYQFLQTITDPVLTIWNFQNQTPSPPIWDVILSFSPALIIVIIGIVLTRLHLTTITTRILVLIWTILLILLVAYLPINLQRRFLLALYPLVGIVAGYFIESIVTKKRKHLWTTVIAFSVVTNIVLCYLFILGINNRSQEYYLNSSFIKSTECISRMTPKGSLILSSPDNGLYIPALTGRRVLYGHPFETAYATEQKELLIDFLDGTISYDRLLNKIGWNKPIFLLSGPEERAIGTPKVALIQPICVNGEYELFRLSSSQ